VDFMLRMLPERLDEARRTVAEFVGAAESNLVFVPNTTTAVNGVLRSLRLSQGDELIITSHGYNACKNAAQFVCERAGATLRVAQLPFGFETEEQLITPILDLVTPRTKLALIDHITSPTAIVMPIARIVRELRARGVETVVDGAHAPGMVPLQLESLGAYAYAGNAHKWLCAPKGAAILHVREDVQPLVRSTVIGHGPSMVGSGRSLFQLEHDWTGTDDPTPWLCVPEAMRVMASLHPEGWPGIMEHNRKLVLAGRSILCDAFDVLPPCPDEFIGSIATVPVSGLPAHRSVPNQADAVAAALWDQHRIEVPILRFPTPDNAWVRISAQLYNALPQYAWLAQWLQEHRVC
jgi:isopenicillin-N epimerase